MNAKTQLTEAAKLQHAISILEILAMYADNADHQCDETAFNLTTNPDHLREAGRSIFAAQTLVRNIGCMADSALKTLGGVPFREGLESWISGALMASEDEPATQAEESTSTATSPIWGILGKALSMDEEARQKLLDSLTAANQQEGV